MEKQELIQSINEAVDSVMIPFLTELITLGVDQQIITTAMKNIMARQRDDDDTTER